MAFPSAPLEAPPTADGPRIHRQQIARILNRALTGALNVTGTVTLAANATTTTLSDPRLGPNSIILFVPQTAHAASAAGSLYVPPATQTTGSAVLNHASSANTDQTFGFIIIG